MMDLFMVGLLVACFFSIKLLADWCEQQLNK